MDAAIDGRRDAPQAATDTSGHRCKQRETHMHMHTQIQPSLLHLTLTEIGLGEPPERETTGGVGVTVTDDVVFCFFARTGWFDADE